MKNLIFPSFLILFSLFMTSLSFAQNADDILGEWYTTEKDAKIKIFKSGNKYSGKIVWLKEPNENGKPKVDENNSDKSKRGQPIQGLELLSDFEWNGKVWENGTIYDPSSGKTYSCTIKKKDDKTIDVRGYIGISLAGKSVEWTKVK
ncbi:DUF2147 domain-containing protein [Belliella kenyensis]|uniref:DUF2147 domain-containing protein n=1 Tax=Belliella kenyensis TaxID=1472724 RepID=A0ABV8EFW5_9BACT|nr:DUF2147 domain-containing protein [Belliella kenyensis]MCH7401733.1 DUF2147 domain-containing protein [Belliella kenyensis]MDN3604233.1 DUF2147 domain-containing protein [Belliella kenyensis]